MKTVLEPREIELLERVKIEVGTPGRQLFAYKRYICNAMFNVGVSQEVIDLFCETFEPGPLLSESDKNNFGFWGSMYTDTREESAPVFERLIALDLFIEMYS